MRFPKMNSGISEAIEKFVDDLESSRWLSKNLSQRRARSRQRIRDTWARSRRATFQYGKSIVGAAPHVVWRRCGTHDVFDTP